MIGMIDFQELWVKSFSVCVYFPGWVGKYYLGESLIMIK